MRWMIGFMILTGASGILLWLFRSAMLARLTRERLWNAESGPADVDDHVPVDLKPAIRRYRWLAVLSGGFVSLGLHFLVGFPWIYSLALGCLTGLIAWQLEATFLAWQTRRLEQQLAEAIDMMIAAVKSGSSLPGALESALTILKDPLRREFDLLVGRVRLGDSPLDALAELEDRVPLETYRLFIQTLSVNWMIGGRLSQTLANVARTIRDRIELNRRLHAMTTQGRLSVISVMVITYFIAALMWRNDPDRMGGFLTSKIGQGIVAMALILQGIGIVWISRISQARF